MKWEVVEEEGFELQPGDFLYRRGEDEQFFKRQGIDVEFRVPPQLKINGLLRELNGVEQLCVLRDDTYFDVDEWIDAVVHFNWEVT